MACGACILFPRYVRTQLRVIQELTLGCSLAFFAISNNVVILALRGMIAEFLFFIMIAVICFSGLLFTLWDLGQYIYRSLLNLLIRIMNSWRNLDGQEHRVAHDTDMVRKHFTIFQSGVEFPSRFCAYLILKESQWQLIRIFYRARPSWSCIPHCPIPFSSRVCSDFISDLFRF
jgi:hypothetical protein